MRVKTVAPTWNRQRTRSDPAAARSPCSSNKKARLVPVPKNFTSFSAHQKMKTTALVRALAHALGNSPDSSRDNVTEISPDNSPDNMTEIAIVINPARLYATRCSSERNGWSDRRFALRAKNSNGTTSRQSLSRRFNPIVQEHARKIVIVIEPLASKMPSRLDSPPALPAIAGHG